MLPAVKARLGGQLNTGEVQGVMSSALAQKRWCRSAEQDASTLVFTPSAGPLL